MIRTLIMTDIQHDFMPGGALGVKSGNDIVPIINALMPHFDHLIATQDWHPAHHVSFASTHQKKPGDRIQIGKEEQILWPDHCVQNTWGAAIVKGLHPNRIEKFVHKGSDPKVDSYSVFFDNQRIRSTGLADYLRKKHLQDLYFCGLTTEYCILYSVLDALELGFRVTVIRDACRPIKPDDEVNAFRLMDEKGACLLDSSAVLREI